MHGAFVHGTESEDTPNVKLHDEFQGPVLRR
jgi:hypothetical protein